MAFGNGNALTANSKTTKKKQLATFIRQLGRYQVNVRAAFKNLLLWPLFNN